MSLIIKGLLAGFWLIIVPVASGALFLKKTSPYTLGECFLAGYLFLFALAEALILPMIYLQKPLHELVRYFGAASSAAALIGAVCLARRARALASAAANGIRSASPYLWCALVLIFLQICITVLLAHFDADDAFYVGTATTSVQTDSLFVVNPYSGLNYRALPSRYILSPFPIFLAVVSQLCAGLHPAITAHVVFAAVFQAMAYLVFYQLGRRWFPDENDKRGIFLFLIAALNCFTSWSVYNAGSFQMVRIWQGKALLAAALLPLVFCLSLSVTMEKEPAYPWLLLLLANISCCLLSSMGIIFAPLMQGIFVVLGFLRFKSPLRALKGLLCCAPSLALGLVYLYVL